MSDTVVRFSRLTVARARQNIIYYNIIKVSMFVYRSAGRTTRNGFGGKKKKTNTDSGNRSGRPSIGCKVFFFPHVQTPAAPFARNKTRENDVRHICVGETIMSNFS